jgi:hypothetical protein
VHCHFLLVGGINAQGPDEPGLVRNAIGKESAIEEVTATAASGGSSAFDDSGHYGRSYRQDAVDQLDLVFHHHGHPLWTLLYGVPDAKPESTGFREVVRV